MDIRDWKMLQIVVSAPLFLLLLLYFVLPESPRWLIATGRYKEAKKTIEKAAKMNGVKNSKVNRALQKIPGKKFPDIRKLPLVNISNLKYQWY